MIELKKTMNCTFHSSLDSLGLSRLISVACACITLSYTYAAHHKRGEGKKNLRAIFTRLLILKTANHIWNCDAFTCCFCNCFCFSLYSPAPLFYFNHLKQWPVFFGDLAYGLGCVVLISFCFVCFTHAAEHLHDKIQFLNFNFKWIYVAAILKCNPILALHTHTHTHFVCYAFLFAMSTTWHLSDERIKRLKRMMCTWM